MKNRILAFACVLLAALVPAAVFAAPKKKSAGDADITCADVWAKKAKDYDGKTVKTYVLEVRAAGSVAEDAAAAVVPVKTGGKNKAAGGDIFVIVPVEEFSSFCQKYQPEGESENTAFGGKINYRTLSGTFTQLEGENVLLFKVKADALKDFSPQKALDTQRDSAGAAPADDLPAGFERKTFYVSKLGKKPYTAAELKRLLGIYNKGKPKAERLTESDVKNMLEDGDSVLSVSDEKAKIQWILRN